MSRAFKSLAIFSVLSALLLVQQGKAQGADRKYQCRSSDSILIAPSFRLTNFILQVVSSQKIIMNRENLETGITFNRTSAHKGYVFFSTPAKDENPLSPALDAVVKETILKGEPAGVIDLMRQNSPEYEQHFYCSLLPE